MSSVLLFVSVAACVPDPGELGPTEALTSFLAAVERSTHAPEQKKLAYEWIDSKSQAALRERAELTASLAGRKLEAWEMLVPGRLSLAGQSPSAVRMQAHVEGDHATVEIPVAERAPISVPLVREEGRWRVVLGLTPSQSE